MITIGELLTVQESPGSKFSEPSKEKLQVIDDAVGSQQHLLSSQKEQLRAVLVLQHEAVSLGKE